MAHRRLIAHADMDAFYASVEQLDDPSLRGRPVLVGGRDGRGVVMACSYESRPYGIHSAMPMSRAVRLCPDAVCVMPRMQRYSELSRIIMNVFGDFSPVVEPLSLDEAFIDLTGTEHLHGPPPQVGRAIKAAVREATGGLKASVGISGTKYVAKVASAHDKPDGLTLVPHEAARDWLAPQSVQRLWGCGPKTTERLNALGIYRIGQLAEADVHWLRAHLGSSGPHFQNLARAVDPRRVVPWAGRKSVGCDRTLPRDISAREDIERQLRRSADEIGRRLRKKKLRARGVRVRLKTSSFKLQTRQARLPVATNLALRLFEAAVSLLERFEHREPYRLVGMAAYDLTGELPLQVDCFDGSERQFRLEAALDRVNSKYGRGSLARAEDLSHARRGWEAPNMDWLAEDHPPEP